MPFRDLRDFLALLEKKHELAKVEVEVDAKFEMGAICRKAADMNGPALLFSRPKGHQIPVVANVITNRKRYAYALESEAETLTENWIKRIRGGPVEPVPLTKGECQENVIMGEDVDLMKFPIPFWNEKDGGHYITAGIEFSKDPESQVRNVAIYRLMVQDKRTLGILAAPYRHLHIQYLKAEAKGERFPVAIAIGVDPVIFLSAGATFQRGSDELAMAGALRGVPVEVVRCLTVPLEVPATSEIVIEGEMPPKLRRTEGPLGEVTGYYGPAGERLFIEVKAITYRSNPIFQASYTGRPVLENQVLNSVPAEAEILRTCPLPGLKRIYLKESACSFIAVAQFEKKFEGHSRWMANAILGTEPARWIKYLIMVDPDIDIFDQNQVDWAVATRSQPSQNTYLIEGVTGVILDPTIASDPQNPGLTSKMVIDATKPLGRKFIEECYPPEEVMRRVESQWRKYGIAPSEREEETKLVVSKAERSRSA